MKVPLSRLKQFLDVPLETKALCEKLTLLGIEVEKVEGASISFSGVVVGKVLTASPHPNADRLQVATVTDGVQEYQVVCGAKNCRAGLHVAFAKIGASLPDEEGKQWKIKKSKIRDVESWGMLSSLKELGLGPESDGIAELPESWALGTDVSIYYSDPILEVSLTPNLGHCLSIQGIARELAAAYNTKIKKPAFSLNEEIDFPMQISVEDPEKCRRYCSRFIQGVTVGPSPEWLQKQLEACGQRSINNVVDATNYVMLELGQPLHAFDADAISGKKIIVSSQTPYHTIKTLDEKERELPQGVLLICDSKGPLGIAGIMGGQGSAATEKTQNIILEAALFSPAVIRKGAKILDLKTESSKRFERGIDPHGVIFALDHAASLIAQIAGGKVSKLVDIKKEEFLPKEVLFREKRVNEILGTHLSLGEIIPLLERLEMHVHGEHVTVPTYRNDISSEIDLIEEVARIYGYNNIPHRNPRYTSSTIAHAPIYLFEQEVRSTLLEHGLQECITCDLISPEIAKKTAEKGTDPISVLHPRSIEQSVLRTSLLPGLLQAAEHNLRHQVADLPLFEVGRVHFKVEEKFKEQSCAGILLSGKARPHYFDPKPQDVDFFDLKGILENLLEKMRCPRPLFEPSHLHTLHPWRQAKVKIGDAVVAVFGQVHPQLQQMLDLAQPLYFAELNLHDLIKIKKREKKFHPLPLFPGIERDWTLSVKDDTPVAAICHAIETSKSRLLESFFLLGLYKSEKIGKDRKNVTFRFIYRDSNQTIEVEAATKEHQRVTQLVAEKLKDRVV